MRKNHSKSKWKAFRTSLKNYNEKLNAYDISKYILNLSYYQYTKKFGTKQEAKVKKLLIIISILEFLFFSALIIQLVCCIVNLLASGNSLYCIGICLCSVWAVPFILLFRVCFYFQAKKYYKVIDFLMGDGSLDPIAVDYPKVIYTYLWYFHTKPMWSCQWLGVKGLVIQTFYGGTKSLAIFIDRLNQFYLDHQNDFHPITNNPSKPNPTNNLNN